MTNKPSITILKPNMSLVCDNVLVAGYESFKNFVIPFLWFLYKFNLFKTKAYFTLDD